MLDMRKKDIFCTFTIRLSTTVDVYFRYYKKIQNLMAEVGGMFKTLILIIFILFKPFTRLIFKIKLLNNLFTY